MSGERLQFDRLHSSELRDARRIANHLAVMIDRDFAKPSEVEGGISPTESYVGKEDVGMVGDIANRMFTFKYEENATTVRMQLAGRYNPKIGDHQWEPVGMIYLVFVRSWIENGAVQGEKTKLFLDTNFLRKRDWWENPLPTAESAPYQPANL